MTLSIFAFTRYPLVHVLRRGKRSLYPLIGIVIALSLIAGSWIAVDSSGIGLMRAVTNEVPVDFIGSSTSIPTGDSRDAMSEISSVVAAIESVENVVAAASFVSVSGSSYLNSSGGVYLGEGGRNLSGTAVFLSNSSRNILDSFKIVGDLPDSGTVAIPKDVADSLQLGIGDDITCSFAKVQYITIPDRTYGTITYTKATYTNITSVISSIWTQQGFENPNRYWFGDPIMNKGESEIWMRLCTNPVVLNLGDYAPLGFNSSEFEFQDSINWDYFVWIDHGEVIRPANVQASIDRLSYIQRQLTKETYSFHVIISDSELISPLKSFSSELQGRKPLFLALSLPVLALGVYLSMIGVDLGVTGRRREAGILKSRGAGNRQVFVSLIIEAFVLGAISGIAGLLLGVIVSRFMLGAGTAFEGGALTEVTDLLVSPATIILCILIGIALMLLSSYGPYKRVSKTEVAKALHEYSPATFQLDYWARTDITLLLISILSIVTVFLGIDWPARQGYSWVVELLVTSLFYVGLALFPVLPFMLSLSVVRLITRSSSRLYSKITWLVRPWTRDLHYLVNKNIVRNPRRASNLCLMISLALAFGLFISITMESTINYEREKVLFEVGTDIKLEASSTGPVSQPTARTPELDGLASLPGVEHAARYSQLDMLFEISWMLHQASSVAMNSTDYLETVKPSDFFFIGGGNELLEGLSDNGSVLLTEDFADNGDLMVGDILPVVVRYETGPYDDADYFTNRFDVVVAGLVKSLPGLQGIDAIIDLHSLSFIPDMDFEELCYREGAFIDIVVGSDPHEVAGEAVGLYEGVNLTCTSTILQDQYDAMNRDTNYESLVGFLRVEYALSIIIMTIGVGLLVFVTVHDREKELACIMARGSSGGQVRRILMGESISLMALGLVIGAGVGILTAYLFNALSGEELYTVVERTLVFTYASYSIVLSSIVALVLAALVATTRAGKIKLAEVLRIRGG